MKDKFKSFNSGRANFFLVAFIALILGGAVLKIIAPIVLPLTIALLLAFVMGPMVAFLLERRIPRICSIILAVIIIIAGLYLMGIILFSSARAIMSQYPRYERRLTEIYVWAAGFFELSYDEHLSFLENLWGQLGFRTRIRSITFVLSNSFIDFLRDAFMVVMFLVFILFEAAYAREKIELAFEDKWAGSIKKICDSIVQQIIRYLSTKFLISLATGIVVGVGLKLAGLEFAIVWGLIQFVLNFIPNIGSIAVGAGATLFAVLQFWPNPAPIILVGLIMLGANIIIGNVLEPKIMGDNLGISPLAVLLSLTIWGFLWGFAGMILAVPMTVVVKIICENIPFLEPVSVLLGSHRSVMSASNEPSVGAESQ
ncbi:AI-2E family transporter [Treponema primitia]|uniref:AI-2E family transporter n=1 Tax=Treponema primitia TaxID=88058 RepID=UPI0002554D68|nr:AI-2E family transporter [Treponema primitia]